MTAAAAAAAAASVIEIVLDDTSTASSRYLQRRQDLDISNYSRDNKPLDLLSINSRHIAEQLTYIDAVRSLQFSFSLLLFVTISIMLIMAARQLAGRRPLYFTAVVSIILFFRRLISEVSGPIVTKLCHMFDGDCNF